VLDPGPEGHPGHVDDVLEACGGRIALILLSHTHHDHHGLLEALRRASGAPTCGFTHSANPAITTDLQVADGEEVAGLTVVHTPGHCADHICFAMPGGVLFSADHVMAWSTTVVSPPGGVMRDYFASLERLLAREDTLYLPGHGPPLPAPHAYVGDLLKHRQARERAIAAALRNGPADSRALMHALYGKLNPTLQRAAERNVVAHLLKLESEGRAARDGEMWLAKG